MKFLSRFSKKKVEEVRDGFAMKAVSFEAYLEREDFSQLRKQKEWISAIAQMPEHLETPTELIRETYEQWEKVTKAVAEFHSESETLKKDILEFTKILQEVRTKYKLSPDWSGKKQSLLTLRGNLALRREEYEKKEERINQMILELYEMYQKADDVFRKYELEVKRLTKI